MTQIDHQEQNNTVDSLEIVDYGDFYKSPDLPEWVRIRHSRTYKKRVNLRLGFLRLINIKNFLKYSDHREQRNSYK